MQLIKVYSNKDSFRTVSFKENCLNFITAVQKNQNSTKRGETYNGVGKSLLVRIIHFCLGASIKDYKLFCEKLNGWEFFLEFRNKNNLHTIKRTTDNPSKITLDLKEISLDKFNQIMKGICFSIPDGTSYLSFRSLLPFFIRPKKESYTHFNKPGKTGTEYQSQLYNAFLLGLDVLLAQKKSEIRKEQDRIQKLEKNFKNDTLLKDFFTGNKDVSLTLVDLEEKINKLEKDLSDFKVAEDYHDVQSEADEIERKLFSLSNNILLKNGNIEQVSNALNFAPDMKNSDIQKVYREASLLFPDNIAKSLDEVETFHKNLITNRKKRLLEQHNKIKIDLQELENQKSKLQKKLNELLQYLGEHQALDIFIAVSEKCASLKAERDRLLRYQELQSEYKTKERTIEKELIELSEVTDNYLVTFKNDTTEIRNYFRNLAKVFYPESVAGLTIENNDGENQIRYTIDAKIESDASDGINNVKIFCYDLTILFKGFNHHIDFIFHDSRVFDGTDERQKSEMFKILSNNFKNSNKQYIATVNQNQLNEIKRLLTDDEYKEIIDENTILTLTDESDSEKLLGTKVDLPEK